MRVSRLNLGGKCNNNCRSCRNIRTGPPKSTEMIKSEIILNKKRGVKEIIFPCNTDRRPDCLKLFAIARYLGMRIVLETNGRMLSENAFATNAALMIDEFVFYSLRSRKQYLQENRIDGYNQAMNGYRNILELGKAAVIKERSWTDKFVAQMVITYTCNRACDYCYAQDQDSQFGSKGMGIREFCIALEWLKRQNILSFNFIGGEPTIHPDISRFMHIATHTGFGYNILSNGLFPQGKAANFRQAKRLIINFQERKNYTPEEYSLLDSNLKELKDLPPKITLSCTLSDDMTSAQHILQACENYCADTVLIDIATPNSFKSNKHMTAERIAEKKGYLTSLAAQLEKISVKMRFSHPLPHCIFGETFEMPHTCASGKNIIVINPDLTVYPCLQIFYAGPPLTRFKTIGDYHKHYKESISNLKWDRYLYPECRSCSQFDEKRCQGACLCYKCDALEKNEHERFILHSAFPVKETSATVWAITRAMDTLDNVFGTLKRKPHIFFFPNQSSMIKYTGETHFPDWVIGFVSGRRFSYYQVGPNACKGLIHEICHLYIAHFSRSRLPTWLSEGFCDIMCLGQDDKDFLDLLSSKKILPMNDITNCCITSLDQDLPARNMAKRQAHDFVSYLDQTFGRRAVLCMITDEFTDFLTHFKKITGRTFRETEKKWISSIHERQSTR